MASAAITAPAETPRVGVRRWLADHPYAAYAIRRTALFVLTLWGALTVTFLFFHLIPGDPITAFIATLEQQNIYGVEAGKEAIEHYKELFGLNGSLFDQYVFYLRQLLITRDLGPSLINFPTPAQVAIYRALPWTIGLLGLSVIISWVFGVALGAFAGLRRNTAASQWLTNVAISLSHVPNYLIAVILVFIFAYRLAWFPPTAAYDPHYEKAFTLEFIGSVIQHGFLPALSLVIVFTCRDLLSTRTLIVPTLGDDYLTFAEAKGLRRGHVIRQYALRNCYLPLITGIAIQLGFVVSGNVIVENIFNYPGIGNLLVQAIRTLDYNTIQGVVAMITFMVLLANLVIDLALPFLDPRVKYWR